MTSASLRLDVLFSALADGPLHHADVGTSRHESQDEINQHGGKDEAHDRAGPHENGRGGRQLEGQLRQRIMHKYGHQCRGQEQARDTGE